MNDVEASTYGELIEPTTLKIQRLLPGPIERVWAYLTASDLRRQWLAAGEMPTKVGAPFTLTWRNDELTDPPGARPEAFRAEENMESSVIACDPPHRLQFAWGAGDVLLELAERGDRVLLTVTHRRIVERSSRLMIGAGWHAHLDILVARLSGKEPTTPFWDGWQRLREEYDRQLPA
ncbi:MAG: SRPBCC family protein [Beijerinckiaceae bacterium]